MLTQYLLAAALLVSPAEGEEATPDVYASLSPTIQAVAMQWEILDPREVRYVLTRSEDFASDLKLLRRRYRELKDAPPLSDYGGFPPREFISEALTFNRHYREYLSARREVDLLHAESLTEAIQETDQLYAVWDMLRDAHCDYYYCTVRRQALRRLRETLGPEAYGQKNMPSAVPLWRFTRLDG